MLLILIRGDNNPNLFDQVYGAHWNSNHTPVISCSRPKFLHSASMSLCVTLFNCTNGLKVSPQQSFTEVKALISMEERTNRKVQTVNIPTTSLITKGKCYWKVTEWMNKWGRPPKHPPLPWRNGEIQRGDAEHNNAALQEVWLRLERRRTRWMTDEWAVDAIYS